MIECGEYIEVALSEAQWATFVSSMNAGSGVQCTLTARNGTRVPQLPEPPPRMDVYKADVERDLKDALGYLESLDRVLDNPKIPATLRKTLKHDVFMARKALTDSVPFVGQSFDEHFETVIEHAKVEINAYVQNAVMRAGLTALGVPPLQLAETAIDYDCSCGHRPGAPIDYLACDSREGCPFRDA